MLIGTLLYNICLIPAVKLWTLTCANKLFTYLLTYLPTVINQHTMRLYDTCVFIQ